MLFMQNIIPSTQNSEFSVLTETISAPKTHEEINKLNMKLSILFSNIVWKLMLLINQCMNIITLTTFIHKQPNKANIYKINISGEQH